jgi:hypothetical protein
MNAAQLETLSRAALEIVTSDRNEQYGEPEDSFAVIAALWTGYLSAKWFKGNMGEIDAADVARMMELMKMARRMTAKVPKADSYIDAIGYVLCEAKMAETE